MRRKKIWVVTLMAFMVLALPGLAQKGKKPKKGKIQVTVTFRDDIDLIDKIRSDSLGSYEKGAFIGAAKGNFHFAIVGKGNQLATRTLFLDFSECTSAPLLCRLPASFTPSGSSDPEGAVNFHTSGIDLREMVKGESRGDLRLSVSLDLLGEGIWTVFFRPNADCQGSSLASVTRIDDVTYEIETGPFPSDLACLGQSVGGHAFIFSGLYRMPFKITLVCKDPTQCVAPLP